MAKTKKETKSFAEQFAEKVTEMLEQGTAPWQKPWTPNEEMAPHNPVSGVTYKGGNRLWLSMMGTGDPRWMTFKQAEQAGYRIRKGAKSVPIEFYSFEKTQDKTDENGKPILGPDGKPEKETLHLSSPIYKQSRVFNAADVEGIPPLEKKEKMYEWDPIEKAEEILDKSGAVIKHDQADRAFYRPSSDDIHLPAKDQFDAPDKYYATALHELGHWTGHETRLNRDIRNPFGSEDYAKEELRAEIGSWMLGQDIGIGHDPGQHAAYVQSWIRAIKEDPLELVRACRDAEKIKAYVLGLERNLEKANEKVPEIDPDKGKRETVLGQEAQNLTAEKLAFVKEAGNILPRSEMFSYAHSAIENLNGLENPTQEQIDKVFLAVAGNVNANYSVDEDITQKAQTLMDRHQKERETKDFATDQMEGPSPEQLAIMDIHYFLKDAAPHIEASPMLARQSKQLSKLMAKDSMEYKETIRAFEIAAKSVDDLAFQGPEELKIRSARIQDEHGILLKPKAPMREAAMATPSETKTIDVPAFPYKDYIAIRDLDTARKARDVIRDAIPHMYDDKGFTRLSGEAQKLVEGPTNPTYHKLSECFSAVSEYVQSKDFKGPESIVEAAKALDPKCKNIAAEKTYLYVPYKEKDDAKALGARWDNAQRQWFCPEGCDLKPLQKYLNPDLLKKPEKQQTLAPEQEFAQKLRDFGFDIRFVPIMDGQIHRVPLINKQGKGLDGAYCLHNNGRPAGWAQDYTTGEKIKLVATGVELTQEERERQRKEYAQRRVEAEKALNLKHSRAAADAKDLWNSLDTAPKDHPYLEAKGISNAESVYLRVDADNRLLVPVVGRDLDIKGIQFIGEDGSKSFQQGMQKRGNFAIVGWDLNDHSPVNEVLICEGYATGVSLHEATGQRVAVALDAYNLEHVARNLRDMFPETELTICADNDHDKEINTGVQRAQWATDILGGPEAKIDYFNPLFTPEERSKGLTDFNDLHQSRGLEEVKKQFESYLNIRKEQNQKREVKSKGMER